MSVSSRNADQELKDAIDRNIKKQTEVKKPRGRPPKNPEAEQKDTKMTSSVRGRPAGQKDVNIKQLTADQFAKLLLKEQLTKEMSDELKDEYKKIKDKDEKKELTNIIGEYIAFRKFRAPTIAKPSPEFTIVLEGLKKEFKQSEKPPSVNDIQNLEKIPFNNLKYGFSTNNKKTYTRATKSDETPVFPTKSRRHIKTEIDGIPMQPVGSQTTSDVTNTIPDMPTKPLAPGAQSIEQMTNPKPTVNPSDTFSPDAEIKLGSDKNAIEFTQYLGPQQVAPHNADAGNIDDNPLLGNSKRDVGQPSNPIANSPFVPPKQEFEVEQQANRNIKDENGNMIRRVDNSIIDVDAKDYANKDYMENQDYEKISKMTEKEFEKYAEQYNLPHPVKVFNKTVHPMEEKLNKMRPKEREEYLKQLQQQQIENTKVKPMEAQDTAGRTINPMREMSEIEIAIRNAEMANLKLKRLQELKEAEADREQNKTIGFRENTGLSTYVSKAGADILTKPEDEKMKSIDAYANMSWITQGARNDSRLTKNSSLQHMENQYDLMRYTDTYNPIIPIHHTRQEMYDMHKDYFNTMTQNRYTPMYDRDYVQEWTPLNSQGDIAYGKRSVMPKPFTYDKHTGEWDLGDYTYNHCCVAGTQNMGFTRDRPDRTPHIDFADNPLIFPNTLYQRETGVRKYF